MYDTNDMDDEEYQDYAAEENAAQDLICETMKEHRIPYDIALGAMYCLVCRSLATYPQAGIEEFLLEIERRIQEEKIAIEAVKRKQQNHA